MTEEEVLAMWGGEELDRIVAVEAMDLICVFEPRYLEWPEVESWYDMECKPTSVSCYSTTVVGAWQVVEHLGGLWDIKRRLRPHPDDPASAEGRPAYQASVSLADYVEAEGIHINQREGKSPWCWQLPEAICIAALLVKIVKGVS